jgi:hypothetical protein
MDDVAVLDDVVLALQPELAFALHSAMLPSVIKSS